MIHVRQGQTTRSGSPATRVKTAVENKEQDEKYEKNENGIISSFRRIFWHPPSVLREQSLMRGQLSSLPYLTWLSLPFQCFSFMVVLPRIHVLLVPGYTLCPRAKI
jgi:hypothetical protein